MSQSGLIVKRGSCRLGGGGGPAPARQSPAAALWRGSPEARTAPGRQGNPIALSWPRRPAANGTRAPLLAPRQALGLACLAGSNVTQCAGPGSPRAYQGIPRSVLERRHLAGLHFLYRLFNHRDRAAGRFHLDQAPPLWGMEGGPSVRLPSLGRFPAASPHLYALGYPGPTQALRWRGTEKSP